MPPINLNLIVKNNSAGVGIYDYDTDCPRKFFLLVTVVLLKEKLCKSGYLAESLILSELLVLLVLQSVAHLKTTNMTLIIVKLTLKIQLQFLMRETCFDHCSLCHNTSFHREGSIFNQTTIPSCSFSNICTEQEHLDICIYC